MNFFKNVILLWISLSLPQLIFCQENLSLELSPTRLPANLSYASAIYDDDDSIYIFGGAVQGKSRNLDGILRYSISEDKLYQVGIMTQTYQGLVQKDTSGNIFYFTRYEVYKFDPITGTFKEIGKLPVDIQMSGTFKYNDTSNQALFFGLFGDNSVTCFDMSTHEVCPEVVIAQEYFRPTVAVTVNEQAFLFSEVTSAFFQRIWRLDLNTFEFDAGPLSFPHLATVPGVVTDGQVIYSVGGYNVSTGTRTDGILMFYPENFKTLFLPVDNFMVDDYQILYGSATVYVEKLNRIYLFGGYLKPADGTRGYFHDEIWYIDLNPLKSIFNNKP